MQKSIQITTPLTAEQIGKLHTGDMVYITGIIYSARDAAHKKMTELLDEERDLPFNLEGNIIYYLGPTPAREGRVIGSAGPTTSSRMDKYTPRLLALGLSGMIGKGRRSPEVIEAIREKKAVYFAAVGGAGALLSQCIRKSRVIAFDELGTEAVREMYVEDFPAIVAVDADGDDIYSR